MDAVHVSPIRIKKFSHFPEEEVLILLFCGFKVGKVEKVSKDGDPWLRVKLDLVLSLPDMTAPFIVAFLSKVSHTLQRAPAGLARLNFARIRWFCSTTQTRWNRQMARRLNFLSLTVYYITLICSSSV